MLKRLMNTGSCFNRKKWERDFHDHKDRLRLVPHRRRLCAPAPSRCTVNAVDPNLSVVAHCAV